MGTLALLRWDSPASHEAGYCLVHARVRILAMPAFRFSLVAVFVLVTLAGAACAALFRPSVVCESLLQSVCIALLFFAALASALYQRRGVRAFWIGFAIVGWGLLALDHARTDENVLAIFIERLTNEFHPPEVVLGTGFNSGMTNTEIEMRFVNVEMRQVFRRGVFWVSALTLAAAGGAIALWISRREERLIRQQMGPENSG